MQAFDGIHSPEKIDDSNNILLLQRNSQKVIRSSDNPYTVDELLANNNDEILMTQSRTSKADKKRAKKSREDLQKVRTMEDKMQ
jgi:hypothetical protein